MGEEGRVFPLFSTAAGAFRDQNGSLTPSHLNNISCSGDADHTLETSLAARKSVMEALQSGVLSAEQAREAFWFHAKPGARVLLSPFPHIVRLQRYLLCRTGLTPASDIEDTPWHLFPFPVAALRHSTQPNLGMKVVADGPKLERGSPGTAGDVLLVWALRAIDEGEEVTVDLTQGRGEPLAAAAWASDQARSMWADDAAWVRCRGKVDAACQNVTVEASAATAKQVFLSWMAQQGGDDKEASDAPLPSAMTLALSMAMGPRPTPKPKPDPPEELASEGSTERESRVRRIWTDLPLLRGHATGAHFEFVATEAEAEISVPSSNPNPNHNPHHKHNHKPNWRRRFCSLGST